VESINLEMQLPPDCLRRTGYRLPTDAEWECACRAGTETAQFFGRSPARLTAYARYVANSGEHLWPVGSLRPNPWGLFDVYGNVLEWCHDREDPPSPLAEGLEPNMRTHVMRSGTYRSVARENRSAKRYHYGNQKFAYLGMRIARTVSD
jgi:formylglycine-generating enzyme required for sulfatase activity